MIERNGMRCNLQHREEHSVIWQGKTVGVITDVDGMFEGVLDGLPGQTFRSPVFADTLECMSVAQAELDKEVPGGIPSTGWERAVEYGSMDEASQLGFRRGLRDCGLEIKEQEETGYARVLEARRRHLAA